MLHILYFTLLNMLKVRHNFVIAVYDMSNYESQHLPAIDLYILCREVDP